MYSDKKIMQLKELAKIAESSRNLDKKIVLCHGCFDLLHIGHIRYLRDAKSMGDILLVTVTPDKYVDKGPNRPAFKENLRVEAIASLGCVDYVAINESITAEETIRLLKPDLYVKGSDFKDVDSDPTGKLALEQKIVKEIGGKFALTNDVVFSSTNLINRFMDTYPEDLQQYLNIFRTRYSIDEILDLLEEMKSVSVLIIGDTIIDEYSYCRVIGTSSKDPVLTLQYEAKDMFAGGVLAVANHVANYSESVRLFSLLGDVDSHEEYIRTNLNQAVEPYFIYKQNASTIIKRRFLEGYTTNKLFEVYTMDDSPMEESKEAEIISMVEQEIKNYDVVIAADFGHGAITKRMRDLLVEHAPFLAVNTQANAGNRGFHTIGHYSSADYISLTEIELRLETRNVHGDVISMVQEIADRMKSKNVAVTQGKKGCLIKDGNNSIVQIPAFVSKVVDRVGCGDAFFAITSLAAYLDAKPELIGFIGNVVGGLTAEILGNQKSIDTMSIRKFITSLLK